VSTKNKILKRGVSGAIVEQISNDDGETVRKTSFGEQSRRLIHQYEWLVKYQDVEFIPKVISYKVEKEFVSYDMIFYKGFKTLSEHAKDGSVELVVDCIRNIILSLRKTIHKVQLKPTSLMYQSYIKEKVENKILECSQKSQLPLRLFTKNEISINGTVYNNIPRILSFLYKTNSLKKSISGSSSIDIHGDLTAENIIAKSSDDFILLDPNPSNGISTRSCEFAKLLQSFHSYYEFMHEGSSFVDGDCNIEFDLIENDNYKKVFNELLSFLTESEKLSSRELLFHEAIHFSRMLPYQLSLNTENFPLYYARMIILFNQVMSEYE
jgi:hypothetical protein